MLTSPPTGPVPDGPLHIGDVADLTGLSLRSIRHYEEMGLVTPASRTAGGFRVYDAEAVARLRLVMDLKIVGLPLDEMRPIVDACRRLERGSPGPGDVDVVARCQDRVAAALLEIEQRLTSATHLGARLAAASDPADPA